MLISKNLDDRLNSYCSSLKLNSGNSFSAPELLLDLIDDEFVTALLKQRSISINELKDTLTSLVPASYSEQAKESQDDEVLQQQKATEFHPSQATEEDFRFVHYNRPKKRIIPPSKKLVRVMQRAVHTNQKNQYGAVDCIHLIASLLREDDECAKQLIHNYSLTYDVVDEFIKTATIHIKKRNDFLITEKASHERLLDELKRRVMVLENEVAALKKHLGQK